MRAKRSGNKRFPSRLYLFAEFLTVRHIAVEMTQLAVPLSYSTARYTLQLA